MFWKSEIKNTIFLALSEHLVLPVYFLFFIFCNTPDRPRRPCGSLRHTTRPGACGTRVGVRTRHCAHLLRGSSFGGKDTFFLRAGATPSCVCPAALHLVSCACFWKRATQKRVGCNLFCACLPVLLFIVSSPGYASLSA